MKLRYQSKKAKNRSLGFSC